MAKYVCGLSSAAALSTSCPYSHSTLPSPLSSPGRMTKLSRAAGSSPPREKLSTIFCAPAGATSVANLYSRVTPCSSGSVTTLWSAVTGVALKCEGRIIGIRVAASSTACRLNGGDAVRRSPRMRPAWPTYGSFSSVCSFFTVIRRRKAFLETTDASVAEMAEPSSTFARPNARIVRAPSQSLSGLRDLPTLLPSPLLFARRRGNRPWS